jgi:hypothetical protein
MLLVAVCTALRISFVLVPSCTKLVRRWLRSSLRPRDLLGRNPRPHKCFHNLHINEPLRGWRAESIRCKSSWFWCISLRYAFASNLRTCRTCCFSKLSMGTMPVPAPIAMQWEWSSGWGESGVPYGPITWTQSVWRLSLFSNNVQSFPVHDFSS